MTWTKNLRRLTDCVSGGKLAVDAAISSSALPTGAATSAKQDTGNASLATIAASMAGYDIPSYLGSPERLAMTGSSVAATLPLNTNSIDIIAEGGDIRFVINGSASSSSPGYVRAGDSIKIQISNLTSLAFYGVAGAYANVIYSQGNVAAMKSYLGSPQRLAMDGTAKTATIPAGSESILIISEGGDIRFAINEAANATSPGYILIGTSILMSFSNITSVGLYGPTGAYADIIYLGD